MNGWRDLKSDSKITIVSIIVAISAVLIINHIQEVNAIDHHTKVIREDFGGETTHPLDVLDASDPVIRRLEDSVIGEGKPLMGHSELSRQEQVSLMAECVEDAIAVTKDFRIRSHESRSRIAVTFFNYRIGEK